LSRETLERSPAGPLSMGRKTMSLSTTRGPVRSAYSYREGGGSAWNDFHEAWRRVARDNPRPALADFLNSIRSYPSASDLATVGVPVVCTYEATSPDSMVRLVRLLAAAIPTATTSIRGGGPRSALRRNAELCARDYRRHQPSRKHAFRSRSDSMMCFIRFFDPDRTARFVYGVRARRSRQESWPGVRAGRVGASVRRARSR
jgi:hypothetical protein